MSVSLLLVPLAMAAVAAVQAATAGRDGDGQIVCEVQTRMRDEALLTAALEDTGARVATAAGETVAQWAGVRGAFRRGADGILSAHFTGDVDEERSIELVRVIDAAYGRRVQQAVLERLRERAPAAGLRLESEAVDADRSVRLVFAVEGDPA